MRNIPKSKIQNPKSPDGWITPARWKTGLEEIAPKVFAYIQAYGELGVSNAGLLVDRKGAMAVDALMVPSMTRRFRSAIKRVTKRPVTRLINTHHHIDHTGGNFIFRKAEIIGHTHCREAVLRTGLPVEFLRLTAIAVSTESGSDRVDRHQARLTAIAISTESGSDRVASPSQVNCHRGQDRER